MTAGAGIRNADLDALQALAGAELTRVSVGKFSATLAFDGGPRSITVEGGAEFTTQGRTEAYNQEIIAALGARVLSLLGRRITEVQAGADRVLRLVFDEGSALTLRPDGSGHECYIVHLPDGASFSG